MAVDRQWKKIGEGRPANNKYLGSGGALFSATNWGHRASAAHYLVVRETLHAGLFPLLPGRRFVGRNFTGASRGEVVPACDLTKAATPSKMPATHAISNSV